MKAEGKKIEAKGNEQTVESGRLGKGRHGRLDVNCQQHNSIARIIIQREKSCKCTEYEPTSVFGTHNQLQAKLQHKSSINK